MFSQCKPQADEEQIGDVYLGTDTGVGSLTINKSRATMSKLSQTNRTFNQKRSKKANDDNNNNNKN